MDGSEIQVESNEQKKPLAGRIMPLSSAESDDDETLPPANGFSARSGKLKHSLLVAFNSLLNSRIRALISKNILFAWSFNFLEGRE